ncbi:MAG TPA: cytochrome c3 family protein [Burkholderiaceae bacterium]|nr:cytochrome c3 family protein [Burkholderiaceae bacterium]
MRIVETTGLARFAPPLRGWLAGALVIAALLLAPGSNARAADRTPFDHLTTGFELLGQHRDLPCESCHVNAIFKGTPKDCSACHGVGTAVRATAKPVSHILSSDRCDACHTPVAWNPAVNFDHAEVRGACSSCHNNVQAQGKGPGHIETSLECNLCHSTIGWAGAVFNHTNVTSGCSSCHNGVGATGPPATHIPTGLSPNQADPGNAPCEACHTPTNYITFAGTAMNHPAVVPPLLCADCHEKGMSFYGVSIVTRPVTVNGVAHPTTGECGNCHTSTVSFAIGNLQPAGHIPTSQPCTLCHQNPADYTQKIMDHTGITGGCALCHAAGLSFPNMAPLVLVTTPANHIAFAGAACESCHSRTNFTSPGGFSFTNASGTAPPAMVHSAVASLACSSCHGAGLTFIGTPPTVTLPAPHIPLAGAECGACHLTDTFRFTNASGTAPPAMVHSAVASIKCSSCHENTMTSWPGVPPTVLRPLTEANGATHPVSGECSDCHQSTVTFKGAGNFPANHIPLTNGTNTNCSTCHTNANDYSVYAMDAAGHALVSGVCSTCHAAGKSFANMAPPTLVQPPANHVPIGTAACESCHSNSSVAAGGFKFTNASGTAPPAMVHAAVGSAACSTCHALGQSWVGTPPTIVEPAKHIPIGNTVCTNCHTAGNYTSFAIPNAVPPMNHAGFTSGCAACHGAGVTDVGVSPKVTVTLPANHIPTGTIACEGCHSNSNFSTFGFTNASGTAPPSMVHTVVTSIVCSTCHEKGKTDIGTPATVVRPALKADGTAHVAAGECSTCHFNTTSFKGATDLPANHIPLPAADNNNCGLCHLDSSTYSTATMNHVNIAANCAQCHAANLSFAGSWTTPLVSPPAKHIGFGAAPCESCHSNTNFTVPGGFKFTNASGTAPPSMVHAAVSSATCSSCHGLGLTWVGAPPTVVEPANHIPVGSTDCTNCHTAGVFTSFVIPNAVPPMNHAGFTTGCANCHGAGKTDVGKSPKVTVTLPANHVPVTGLACEGCHSNSSFNTFAFTNASGTAPPSMVHSLVTGTACSTCHEAGKTWVGTPATKVRPALKADGTAHVATGECSTCHFNTTSFKGATDLPANHIPLPAADNNNCALCHTTGDYGAYVMNHANISSNCMQCHGYGLSFANIAAPQLVQPPAGATGHIPTNPPNSTSQNFACELCHTPTVFTSFAGTVMKHAVVRSMTCMSCHEYGMTWKTNTGVRLWVRDGKNHHAGQDCGGSGCHSTRDKHALRGAAAASTTQKAGAANTAPALSAAASVGGGAVGFSHRRVAGTPCVSCHGPTSGIGKPADHMATGDRCDSCHMTLAWLPVTHVDHTQVQGTCVGCHNGVVATGKDSKHIASNGSCETCHTTNAWSPARFDHNSVAPHTCKTCHDSIHATGLPANHVPTSAQCDTCHGTLGWKPALLDHTKLSASCASCHDNRIALGVPPAHLLTALDCATCHSYPDWSVLHFTHAAATYPGDHRAALTCTACHTANTDKIPWASPADAGSCGGCHAKDFVPARHPKTLDGLKYSASELRNCAGACHVYGNATLGTVAKPMPGPYHRVTDAAFKH